MLTTPENSSKPCDTGTDLQTISQEFPQLDFSTVDKTYPNNSFGTPYAFQRSTTIARGLACLEKLYTRPEKVVAVVSHAGFLRTVICRRRFSNADYRVFCFARDANGRLELFEDDETEAKGGAMGRSETGVFQIESWDFPSEDVTEIEWY